LDKQESPRGGLDDNIVHGRIRLTPDADQRIGWFQAEQMGRYPLGENVSGKPRGRPGLKFEPSSGCCSTCCIRVTYHRVCQSCIDG
jgi:hypothetical protein